MGRALMAREGIVPALARQAQFQFWIFSYHIFALSPKTTLSRLMFGARDKAWMPACAGMTEDGER